MLAVLFKLTLYHKHVTAKMLLDVNEYTGKTAWKLSDAELEKYATDAPFTLQVSKTKKKY